MDEKISAAIEQYDEDRKRVIEAAMKEVNGVCEKGKGIDLNEYCLVAGMSVLVLPMKSGPP